ncbi:hypothetical protein [Mesorhizobium sp. M0589]|uniref:hypothetical protein n=1 Tax=Mesorhizobium sp. M0589 TaxID=2956965 RepID=UPI003336680E
MIAVFIRIGLRYGAGVLVARGLLGADDAAAFSSDPDIQAPVSPSPRSPRPGTGWPANPAGSTDMEGFQQLLIAYLEAAKPYAIGFAAGLVAGWLL